MEANQIIEDLIQHGITKWKISKELNVSWNTLRMWQRGVFKPSTKNLENLKNFYAQQLS